MEITVVLLHIEIYASVALVGITRVENLLNGFNLLQNMAGGTRLDGRRGDIELAHSLVIAQSISLHHLHRLQLLEAGLLCNLILALIGIVLKMTYIGDVPHISDLIAKMPEQLAEHIVSHPGTGMAQMGFTINGRTADIHSHVTGMNGLEQLLGAA